MTKKERMKAAIAFMLAHPKASIASVHRQFRLSRELLRDLRVEKCGFKPNAPPKSHRMKGMSAEHEPTPLEIRQRCAEIQKTWTPAMRYSRAKWAGCDEYEAPEYTLVQEKRTVLWFEQVG
jgi:hypothetical protein